MHPVFDSTVYVSRREKLKKSVGSGLLLFLGNEFSPMNYADNTYPFRQDSNFLYFFGINLPSLTAIIDIDKGKEIIFGDDPTIDMIVWTGNLPKIADYGAMVGITDIRSSEQLSDYLKRALSAKRTLHYLQPYRPENKWKINQLLGYNYCEIQADASLNFIKAVIEQREIKSDIEIAEIEKAVNISIDMHVAAIKFAKPGMTEAQVAAEAHKTALAAGGDISFPIIATINGQTLHNHYHGNTLKNGDLFLIDAGAQTEMMYTGDLSSTFPVSGKFTQTQKDFYSISLEAHRKAVEMLKPGINFYNVHMAACRAITEGMKDYGLMKGNTEDALNAGAHALFFPCGTGHMMGLDVHDMEDLGELWVGYNGQPRSKQFGLKSLRLAKPLKPGFVFTIEPGIYFIPELIDLWKAKNINSEFLNFNKIDKLRTLGGIRNEENFVITETGVRKLGKPFDKSIKSIEEMRL